MYNVNFHPDRTTEKKLTDLIFKACRANENRADVIVDGFKVSFNQQYTKAGEFLAMVFDSSNQMIGAALVDEFDC